MTKYASLSDIVARDGTGALPITPGAAPAADEGQFSKGLRSGMTSAGGQLRALAGGIGEAVGANDFAREQFAASAAAEQLAQQQAPTVGNWREVTGAPDLATGLRRGGQYVAGLAGQALPLIGLGVGAGALTAATGGGALPALAAGTAAVAPFEVGGALQRQQADPAMLANNDAGTRLGTAAVEGVGRAGLSMAVPLAMGGKLLGRAATGTTMKGAVAANLGEAVAGNAAAGAGAEGLTTLAQTRLNPERDTSGDAARMTDAAVAGGVLGVPFAGMGIAGHALSSKAKPGAGKADAPLTSEGSIQPADAAPVQVPLTDRIKGLFTATPEDPAARIAKGEDIIDVDALRNAAPEQQGQMLREADGQRGVQVKQWYDELMSGDALSPDSRAKLQGAAEDFGSRANQAVVAGVKLASEAGTRALNMASEFYKTATKKTEDAAPAEGMPLKSEIGAGADKAIGEAVTPMLAEKFPQLVANEQAMKAVTGGLRRTMDTMQKTGKIDADVAEHLHGWFGDDTPAVLAKLHDSVMGDDKSATERYFAALNTMTDEMGGTSKLADQVKAALSPELQKTATPESLKAAVKALREYATGAHTKDMPPARAAFESKRIEDGLRQHFGDKTDKLLESFHKESKKNQEALALDAERTATGEDGLTETVEHGVTTEQDVGRQYFGGGKDKAKPTFILSERAHRAQFGNEGSQAARLMRDVQAKNPDQNVRLISAHEYAQRHSIGKAQLMDMTNGKPDDHVMVVAEGMKRDGLTWQDVDGARLDTHKYPNSKSRIDTEEGTILDAQRLMKMYAPHEKLPFNEQDAGNPMHRLRRQFTEAIAAMSDHLGEVIDVPDYTVVARRAGRDVTWGELQKAGRVKPEQADSATTALFTEREAAVKAGNQKEVTRIDNDLSTRAMRANDPDDVLPDGAPKKAAVNNDRADLAARDKLAGLAAELGAARKAAEAEIAKKGPLRDSDGVVRPMTMRERALIKEHDKLATKYEEQMGRVGRDRPTEFDTEKARLIMDEAPLDRNIHWAEHEYGNPADRNRDAADWQSNSSQLGDRFKASENMDADGNPLHASNFNPDTHFDGKLSRDIVSGIESRVSQFENHKTAIGRAIGAKGRKLVELAKSGQMKMQDQALLASIMKDRDATSRAEMINELHAQYKNVEVTAKKPSAFVERVLGKGDLAPVVAAIKGSDDVGAVRRAVDALVPHATEPRAKQVLDAANERITAMLERDPSIAYSMQRVNQGLTHTGSVKTSVAAHIEKVLGPNVQVLFSKMLHAGEFVRKYNPATNAHNDIIRVSVHALDPMGTAYHESLHGFFANLRRDGQMDGTTPVMKAADSKYVRDQLNTLLAGEPDALRQVATSAEERAAYMYQFWAAGKLSITGKPATALTHVADFFRSVLGMWSNDARAEHILEFFHSGKYAAKMSDRNAVSRVLKEGSSRAVEQFKSMVEPINKLGMAVFATGDGRLRGTNIGALVELADKVYAPLHGEAGGDPGYIPAARVKRGEIMNSLAVELGRHDTASITDALAAMQRGEKGSTPAEKVIVRTVRKVLDDAHDYMKEAGVAVADLGYGKDYFPRAWDAAEITSNEKAFRDMLEHYRAKGEFDGSTDQIIAALTRSDGSELQVETARPGMIHTKERVLGFISALDAAPFLEKDGYRTINSYITQATRRAEWARRFKDDGSELQDLLHRARSEGATTEQLSMASDYLQGVDGTLGDKIDPKLRRAFGNMIVYQNVRLLPLAVFSSLIDPGGVLVRGGTVKEAWNTMKRGFAEIPKGFKDDAKHDTWTDLASELGVIDNAVLMKSVGSTYTQGMTSNLGRKINDTFFKYNLMEQFNTSMRVGATEAAVGFLGRHADGKASPHSPRWLSELGFKPGEIVVKNGRPLMRAAEFESHGLSPDDAQIAADRMSLAVNKWVDGAILRPNAAHKPVWMNDPRYALFSHLKQFVYAFQQTILKRVVNETKFGNLGPAYSLAAYVPFMLAADLAKGMIVGGGSQPGYKDSWELGDYIWSAMQRAGLFGVGQFGLDAAKDLQRGGVGIGALGGPTVEQLADAASVVAGPQQFKTFAINALPANQLIDGAVEPVMTNAAD